MFIVEINGKYGDDIIKSILQEIPNQAELNLLLSNNDQINISIDKNKITNGKLTFTDLTSLLEYLKNHNMDAFTIVVGYCDIIEATDFVKKIENKYNEYLLSIRIYYIINKTIYERKYYDD